MTAGPYPPLKDDHPLVGDTCPVCEKPFEAGDVIGLVTLGPAPNPEDQAKYDQGRAHTAVAQPVHWRCNPDEPFLKTEVGWYGVFTRRQADGAIPNGTRIVKAASEKGDSQRVGALGTVLGSLAFPPGAAEEAKAELRAKGLEPHDVAFAYFVEWDALPRHAVGIMDWKIGRADAE